MYLWSGNLPLGVWSGPPFAFPDIGGRGAGGVVGMWKEEFTWACSFELYSLAQGLSFLHLGESLGTIGEDVGLILQSLKIASLPALKACLWPGTRITGRSCYHQHIFLMI